MYTTADECPICLQPLDNEIMNIKCCKKPFHLTCYNQCMIQKLECPLCRTKQEDVIVIIKEPVIIYRNINYTFIASVSFVICFMVSLRFMKII